MGSTKEKIGIIDVGGGCRGVYAAGVFDYCLDNQIHFDLGIGVSAGSANLASFFAKQPRRNLQFYTEYGLRKEYMSIRNFVFRKSYIGLDYVYSTLSNSDGESPLDYDTIQTNPSEFVIVATEAVNGAAHYFTKTALHQDNYDVFKASNAIPYVCQPYVIDGIPYFDGALSDPIPLKKAFTMGCDKVILLLTLPADTIRTPEKDIFLANRIRKKYPVAANKLENRTVLYNEGVSLARQYEAEGKVLIVAPDNTCGVNTLCRNYDQMIQFYTKGYHDGEKIKNYL